jgi:hypothetical protein
MKVWTNRVPTALVEAWGERAKREDTTASAMLRHVMETALASARPIMPASTEDEKGEPRPAPEACPHPRDKRRPLGYTTLCGVCMAPVRR